MTPSESGIGWGRSSSSKGCLTGQTGDVAGASEGIGEDGCLGAVGQAVVGRAFHPPSPLVGVAAFGVTEATDARFPRGGIDLEITGEADVAIGKSAIDDDGAAKR